MQTQILFFPLHIKFGLMKWFMKTFIRKSSKGFEYEYVKAKFPKITEAKLTEGVFISPQVKELLKENHFLTTLGNKRLEME